MPHFGQTSLRNRSTCHEFVRDACDAVIKRRNCRLIHGWRGPAIQNEVRRSGFSTKRWPYSMHNTMLFDKETRLLSPCSLAVDLMPYYDIEPHIRWNDEQAVHEFTGYVKAKAEDLGIELMNGYDWDMDLDFHDQTLMDGPHYQSVFPEIALETVRVVDIGATWQPAHGPVVDLVTIIVDDKCAA